MELTILGMKLTILGMMIAGGIIMIVSLIQLELEKLNNSVIVRTVAILLGIIGILILIAIGISLWKIDEQDSQVTKSEQFIYDPDLFLASTMNIGSGLYNCCEVVCCKREEKKPTKPTTKKTSKKCCTSPVTNITNQNQTINNVNKYYFDSKDEFTEFVIETTTPEIVIPENYLVPPIIISPDMSSLLICSPASLLSGELLPTNIPTELVSEPVSVLLSGVGLGVIGLWKRKKFL